MLLIVFGGWGSGALTTDPPGDGAPSAHAAAGSAASGGPAPGVRPVSTSPAPTAVSIPSIGVASDLMRLDLTEERRLEVPPLSQAQTAGWYQRSPTPGATGAAVIVGHVDSAEGPAVFYDLGDLRRGAKVRVDRVDGSTAVFRVDRLASYLKSDFPTKAVYGQVPYAELRLITCGGDYDRAEGGYQSNTVVYATLVRIVG
ncbi:class F sortase [Nocardioides sp. NPDC101246]|uniref:class F sortase n=1 Tax=Nocardioides sp. NPDC101246 TaxID=3364336 RepID=UPI0037FD1760